jgi:hypothetical protein
MSNERIPQDVAISGWQRNCLEVSFDGACPFRTRSLQPRTDFTNAPESVVEFGRHEAPVMNRDEGADKPTG